MIDIRVISDIKIITMDKSGVIEKGYIAFDNGKIVAVGEGKPPADLGPSEQLTGMIATPGFIDAHTHLGIVENGLDFEGDDANEDSDPITPQLRALDAINPLDKCFSEARSAGVTTAAIAPGSANPIGGQIVVLKTCGKCVDQMIVRSPAAIKFALGENPKSTYHGKNAAPVTRMATAAIIRETLAKAKRYSDDLIKASEDEEFDEPEYDIKLESLLPLVRGEIPAHFHAHRADDIFTAIRISKEFGLKYTIVHATEGHLIADELAKLHCDAIVGPNLADRCKPELVNQTFENPYFLDKAGVRIAITTDHPVTPLNFLPLCAALAEKNKLPHYSALRAVTISPAEILGIESTVGSISVGKDADILLFSKDPLSIDATPERVYVDGELT